MNVSSVKNLNGETFSAVQDATLTDVVQSNSAQWGQGSEFPISADEAVQYVQTNSAGIDDTVSNVQTNSGVWGGSALPISAGPGIKVNLVDNTLVFSNDETVLYSGVGTSACALNENPTNFNRIRVEDIYHNLYEFAPSIGDAHQEIKLTNYTGQPQQLFVQFSATNDTLYVVKGFQTVYSTWDEPGNATWTATNINNTYSRQIMTGVTGINRK